MDSRCGFKQTEMSVIPDDWVVEDFEKIGEFFQGLQVSLEQQETNPREGYKRFVRIVDFTKSDEPWRYIRCKSGEFNVFQDDLIMIRYGSQTAGKVFKSPEGIIANNMFKIKIVDERVLKNFLYYFLSQNKIYKQLNASQTSSTMPSITFELLSKLKIVFPLKLEEQRAIAKILSDLDNKIELNRQINETLEAIGQAIFKHWFVDFEFPNEKGKPYKSSGGKMVDSELGKIPEGWRVIKISQLCNIVYGKNLPTQKLKNNGYVVFGGNGIIGRYDKYIYEEPQIIVSCRGANCGNIYQTHPKSFVTNNSLVFEIISNSLLNRFYLKYFLTNTDINQFITGSAQPQITVANLNNLFFLVPDQKQLKDFEMILFSIDEIIFKNICENQNLSQIRDLLLPKLMSGKIRVTIV